MTESITESTRESIRDDGGLALRIAGFIDRRRWAILIVSLVLGIFGAAVASRLPVHGDFSYLLPPNAPSVLALHALEERVTNVGTLMVAIEAKDPALRARAAAGMHERLLGLDKSLVDKVLYDDNAARAFVWDNRFLYADKADLGAARDQLADAIRRAKLAANPLYVNFDDDDGDGGDQAATPASAIPVGLENKLNDAKARRRSDGFVSDDGTLQLIVVRTPFEAGAAAQSARVVAATEKAADATRAEVGPGVDIGLTGDVVVSLAEHDALLEGMVRAALLTALIVAVAMILYYRSAQAVAALLWALAVGTVLTFAFTKVAIGHLNVASAFLSSIVVGNGINFGILVVARHLEEKRRGLAGVPAIAAAMRSTLTGTLAAALTATVAYGSLLATQFKGFRHFGLIGGVGMLLCWLAAYTILPAGLAVLERRGLAVSKPPALGALLARLAPRGNAGVGLVAAVAMLLTGAAGYATYRYLQNPYEDNFANLRSSSAGVERARVWLKKSDDTFGRSITGGFVLLAPSREAARALRERLREVDRDKAPADQLLGGVRGLDDLLPSDQPEKLAILADLRRMIDHEARNLAPADRARLEELRPPDRLEPIGDADLPEAMAWPFTEKDGTRGRIILADTAPVFNEWLAHDLLAFTDRVQKLDLGSGTLVGGAMFVFADVIRSLQGDGPRSTGIALVGAVLIIGALVGLGRHGAIALLCMGSGTLLMLAGAWLVGLRVNFLDFVALPITIGIGIDYSVNIVARSRQDGPDSARQALATTGGAVALCSFTTMIGYGSLILSANQGIRSFGLAAIIGELACIAAALLLAPALLQLFGGRDAARSGAVVPVRLYVVPQLPESLDATPETDGSRGAAA